MAMIQWIVVADASRARIFEAPPASSDSGQRLQQVADLANPDGRAREDDLVSHSAGRGRPGARTGIAEDNAGDHSLELFSRQVARFLQSAHDQRRYHRLHLFAAPRLLGRLRRDLSDGVRRIVAEQKNKDIAWFDDGNVDRYFKMTH
ncbi:MAG TPA: host attachment protein [Burkholderiales bacterium]|nr:host attachment protein [Burkholderiales bacterium]